MYVVQVVQAGGSGLLRAPTPHAPHNRHAFSVEASSAASNSSCIHLPAPPDAVVACQPPTGPGKTAQMVPWMRKVAVNLMRSPHNHPHNQLQQRRMGGAIVTRSSTQQDCSVSVLTGSGDGTGDANNPNPLVIHLPGADGTSEGSPTDPASGGLPATPAVVSADSNSLALRGAVGAVQQRSTQQRGGGQLGFRPDAGSKALPTMLRPQQHSALQPRMAAGAPAQRSSAAASGSSLQTTTTSKPLGFLQWPGLDSNSSSKQQVYWGSPIGGTLYINPSIDVEGPAAAAQGGAAASSAPAALPMMGSGEQLSNRSRVFWGSPIGGTLFINPSLDDAYSSAEAAAGAAAAAASSSTTSLLLQPRVADKSLAPFRPPFQLGSSASASQQQVVWGSPIGGTLYINPQAPADWHEGSWGSTGGGGGSGQRSGGGGRSSGANNSSRQPNSLYASARGAQSGWGAVPPGAGLVRLGVGLMAAMAAAGLALYLKATPSSTNNNSKGAVQVSSVAAPRAPGTAASGAAAASAEATADGPGFHQWMVQRLQSTLDGFEAEQQMLQTELAMLSSMQGASGSKGVLGGLKRWLGGSNSSSSTSKSGAQAPQVAADDVSAAAGVAATQSSAASSATHAAAAAASLSPADVAARVAEIQEQLESIAVLKGALSAELSEQQQLLRKEEAQQQAQRVGHEERMAALTGR